MRFTIPLYRKGFLFFSSGIEWDRPFEVRFFGPSCWIFKFPGFNLQYYSTAWRRKSQGMGKSS